MSIADAMMFEAREQVAGIAKIQPSLTALTRVSTAQFLLLQMD